MIAERIQGAVGIHARERTLRTGGSVDISADNDLSVGLQRECRADVVLVAAEIEIDQLGPIAVEIRIEVQRRIESRQRHVLVARVGGIAAARTGEHDAAVRLPMCCLDSAERNTGLRAVLKRDEACAVGGDGSPYRDVGDHSASGIARQWIE